MSDHKEPKAEKEKTKEIHAKGGPAKDGHAHEGEAKKHTPPPVSKSKGHTPMPDGCHAWGCKGKSTQFNFCAEHFDHFKFGLIKKTGEPVPDYERKFEHFLAHKAKRGSQKVA